VLDNAEHVVAACAQLTDIGAPLHPAERDSHVAPARAALRGDREFDAPWQEGGAMSLDQALEYALAEPDAASADA